tara:strand:+ start:337 stop:573 length:237 start_codon:yes stop_codon:yes gene_type:complete
MTLREIFTSSAEGVSTVFNLILDTNIFGLIGMFVILVMGPYYAFTLLISKEKGKKIIGGFFALASIFFYYLVIDVLIK